MDTSGASTKAARDYANLGATWHLTLAKQLDNLQQCKAEVSAIQRELYSLSAQSKLKSSEWQDARSRERLAVIRTRRHFTLAKGTYREVMERLRRDLYKDDQLREQVKNVCDRASYMFDRLVRENF